MVYLPIIGAFLEAVGTILEKKLLKHKKIDYRNYTGYGFLAIVLVLLPIIYFFHEVQEEALVLKNILIFLLVIFISILANVLFYYSLKKVKIIEFEPIRLMQPLFTILLAVIVYKSERNWTIVLLAIIASISLVVSHLKKHHLAINKYTISVYLSSLFFAVELVASKTIIQYYNPFFFYFLRCFFIFLFSFLIFKPSFSILAKDKKIGVMTLIIAAIWVVYRAIIYYGYGVYGVVVTTLLFILAPVFLVILAVFFLHEKPSLKQIISIIIMIACVAAAIILNH